MGITKEGWIKRRLNGNGSAWNKGKKGVQKAWNKGLTKKDNSSIKKMGFQKGHKGYLKGESRKKSIENHKGPKHWRWKGGITPAMMQIRNCHKTRLWRSDVFKRDNYTCQECLSRGCYLEAHHIKPFSKIIEENNIKTLEQAEGCDELWDINNGLTLCSSCHNITKSNSYKLKNIQYTA